MRQRKTHETRRGFAALLLSLCAIVSTLAVALPAKAAADDVYVPEAPADKQNVTVAGTLDEAARMLTDGGIIYLTGDATVNMAAFAGGTVTVRSYGSTAHTVKKSGSDKNMLMLSGNADVTLENVVFDASGNVNGRTVSATGGSTLTLGDGAVLENNTVYGAVYLDNSVIIVDGGEIRNNHAVMGDIETKSCTLAGSYSAYTYTPEYGERQPLGGAVLMVNGSTLELRSGKLSRNTAWSGGAVFASDLRDTMTLVGGEISHNETDSTTGGEKNLAHGGAISIEKSAACKVVISGVSVKENTSGYNGGGLYIDYDVGAVDLTMTGGTFSGNKAGRNGAIICSLAYDPVIDISGEDSVFDNNESATYGGLYLTRATDAKVPMPAFGRGKLYIHDGVSFSGNKATYGSCLSVTKNGAINDITLKDCTFRDNSATNNGGAFYTGLCFNATMTIDGGTYENNYSGLSGGAFYAQIDRSSSITIQGGAKFEENVAKCNAGAFSLKRVGKGDGGTVQLLECDVINNRCNADFENYPGSDKEPTMHYNTGGVYVGEDVTCYMYDALITENYVLDGYVGNVIGSGIALCPNAAVYLFPEHGATIYDNGGENTMDILAVPYDEVIDHETPAKLYVSDTAPDGRPYNWEDLNGDRARTGQYDWTSVTHDIATVAAFDAGSSGETDLEPVGFKANLEPGIQTMAATGSEAGDYKVNISGNYSLSAFYGAGGVMVNGTVISGELSVSIEKKVEGTVVDPNAEYEFTLSITEQDNLYDKQNDAQMYGFNGTCADDKVSIGVNSESDPVEFKIEYMNENGYWYPTLSYTFTLKADDKLIFPNFKDESESESKIIFADDDSHKYAFTLEEIDKKGAPKTVYETTVSYDSWVDKSTSSDGTTLEGYQKIKKIEYVVINRFTELDLTKEVADSSDTTTLWEFEIVLTDKDGYALNDSYPVELWQDGEKLSTDGRENGLELTDGVGWITPDYYKKVTVKLKHGQTLKIKGLPEGSKYSITETTVDGYTSSKTDSNGGIIPNNGIANVKFTNTPLGSLKVTKTVEGVGAELTDDEKDQEFKFTVEMTQSGDVSLDDVTYSGSASATREGNKWTFSLKHGESMTFSNIPAGTTYTVTETYENGYSAVSGGAVNSVGDYAATGDVTAGETSVAFTNKHVPGPEKTEKKVGETDVTPPISEGEGPVVKVGDEITYEITWANDTNSTAEVKVEDKLDKGVSFVSADNGGTYDAASHTVTWTLTDRGAGESGKVTLVVRVNDSAVMHWDYNDGDYLGTPSEDVSADYQVVDQARVSVTVAGHDPKSTVTPKIRNPLEPGSLTVSKTVTGDGAETDKQFDFTLTLEPKAGVTLTYEVDNGIAWNPADIEVNRDGDTLTFKLAHGQSVTFTNVPAGTEYAVTEKHADGYITTVENGEATLDGDMSVDGTIETDGNTLDFTNEHLSGPEKTETAPGDRQMVALGQEITYRITWINDKSVQAEVTVADRLDPGVDFVSADNGGAYDADSHTVTWSLGRKPSGETGEVRLTVRVNEKAFDKWTYNDPPTGGTPGEGKDYEVWNQAGVEVGDDWTYTSKVENPVPDKEEATPGAGETVGVGEEITYRIHWKNGHTQPATVTITDALDEGLDFVSASDVYSYNMSMHTVTWLLENCPAGAEGDVELTVRVNEQALKTWTYNDPPASGKPGEGEDYRVVNQALVQVGDDPQVETRIIPNPLKPDKVETDPGDGVTVRAGQVITYQIAWVNDAYDKTTGRFAAAYVKVTDPLDDGVDYVDSDPRGVYDQEHHAVVWDLGLQTAGAHGVVTLRVRVNERANRHWAYGPEQEDPDSEDLSTADGTTDDQVVDRAYVQVDNGSKVYTQTVRNPLKPGALTVRKTVEGEGGPQAAFNFRVELSDKSISGEYGDMTFTDGVATFTLKNGESKTATGLPAGTGYTVTEAEANLNGYATTQTGAQGVIPEGDTALASFVNKYALPEVPVTGDGSRPGLWAALACVCALSALLLARRLRGEG